jgi:RsiW-degrading membrane proteinase PrsW (M82 family)
MEYYPAIYEARHTTSPTSWWYQRLSLLSRWALISTAGVVLSLFAVSMLSLRKNIRFGPMNFLIFFLTLLQSWAVVIMVYWKSRKDVSFDALVKFFASGFWLSTSLAVFYELLFGFIIRATMGCLMAMSGVDEVEQNGYQYTPLAFIGSEWMVGQVNYSGYRAYLEVYGNDHPVIYTLYLFMVTFFLAAGVEEICKYFGFRMIEHPDQLSRAEIEDAAECTENEERHESFFTDQDRPHHSRAASVTVSMVTVAAGFACAENLVYVFLYGGSAVSTQASILLIRSFFPIHPVAAALQSVRVVQRDVEKDADMKLGGILKPAVVFHGLFDFVVLFTSYIGSR